MAFHGFHGKDQSNKKRDLLPLFTLHDFMFSEKKMKKVMKSIEDSFEYTQRSNEFEQIHNTPEKIMKYADTIVAEIEKKERLLSKRKTKQLVFVDEDSIRTESQFHHPVSYFAPHSPEIADNEEEISDSHSFDEQIHAMNENIGGNVADNTSEVEMVEKLQNQETYLTIRPEHQHEHHKSRETIAFLKEKIFKKKSDLDQDLEFKKINADRDVMLAKAVDALNRERSQKHKIESFSKSYMEEKEFLCKIIENDPGGSYFCEESACEMCRVIMPKQTAFSLSLPKSHGQLKLWKDLYIRTPQDICNYASVFYGLKGIKKSSSDFKDLAYWDLETITSMIHYIIHELHPSDVKVIFDLDENPEKGNNNPYIYQGDCHPLHHESNYVLIVYCKRSDEEENNHFVHYLFAINDGLCQVRDPGKDASLDEHYDQVFHLARKYCIIPGCRKEFELLCTDTGYLPQEFHIPEEIGFSESFYTGTKAPLQISMATEHDSMLFQPEDDSGWSCGPFTIVKVLETLLQLERNGKTKFLGKRAHFRLETESWKVLKRQVVPTDRTDDFLSITSDPPTKSTYFHLGTVWPQVTTTNSREDMFQLEITVLQFCIDKILTSYLDLKMLNEVFGRVPCNSSFKKHEVVYVKSMMQQSNDKLAPFKWYNHAPLGKISGCIKIDKMLKRKFVSDDSPSGIKLKKFADSYRTAVEKWRSKISDETRRTILGSLGVKKNK